MSLLSNRLHRFFSRGLTPLWCVLLLDCLVVAFAGFMCAYIEYGGDVFISDFLPVTLGVAVDVSLFLVAFVAFHTSSGWIRYTSSSDLLHILAATTSGSILTAVVSIIVDVRGTAAIVMPHFFGILGLFFVTTFMMWVIRLSVRTVYEYVRQDRNTTGAFVYGVGADGVAVAKSLQSPETIRYVLAGFVSPFNELNSKYLIGVKVRRDGPNLIAHMKKAGATAMMVSPLQAEHFIQRQDLIDALVEAGITIYMMPNPEEWDGSSISQRQFKEVDVEDLLPREPIDIDMTAVAEQLEGKCILITGAAGSIGSEMVRQIAKFAPKQLVLVDQAETPMHDIRLMMRKDCKDVKAETIVASITDGGYMENLFAAYRPEYVFHAAAYKHVPMMENNPAIAVQNNIRGTRVIADLSVRYGVRKFVMVSTDKAVNPTNVMGCSKRICEIYCQSLNKAIHDGKVSGVTQFVTTRFGNVLGSNGSVIPLFREQIRNGGPVTVTHPDIIRYFMLIPEACKLVLEAGTIGRGGEIFVFDMGNPVRIADLAKRMIALSGAKGIEIRYTGLRDGEKLYEEVLSDKERTKPTPNAKIFVADVREYDYAEACRCEEELLEMSYHSSSREIVRKMMEVVPEYKTNNFEYH